MKLKADEWISPHVGLEFSAASLQRVFLAVC